MPQGRGLVCWLWGKREGGGGRELSLTGFAGWSRVLSASEMSLLVLAVINVVYDMFVDLDIWTQI